MLTLNCIYLSFEDVTKTNKNNYQTIKKTRY